MSLKHKCDLSEKTHNLRMNQAVSIFGPGAMVDFVDQTLMAVSPDYWDCAHRIFDERLEKSLSVSGLYMPPDVNDHSRIPFTRFPKWYFCPSCRKFKPISQWEKEYVPKKDATNPFMKKPVCQNCNKKLVPAGIITICPNGHIDDFPWIEWTHVNNQKQSVPVCSKPDIRIKTGSSGLGLEGIKLECDRCKAVATMKGAFGSSSNEAGQGINAFEKVISKFKDNPEKMGELQRKFKCHGHMHWNGKKEECIEYPITVQRGASNVYFPKIESSIIIPPYSESINSVIDSSRKYTEFLVEYNNNKERGRLSRFLEEDLEYHMNKIADETGVKTDLITDIINRRLGSGDAKEIETKNKYREEEYEALKGSITEDAKNTRDFTIEEQDINEYGLKQLSKVVLVKRLREVRALLGFTRVHPPDGNMFGDSNGERKGRSSLISLKTKENWYPAYEVRGAGIFIEISQFAVDEWVEKYPQISNQANSLNQRYNKEAAKYENSSRQITPKFLLLHTLSHLLIRELSFECGYATASLGERIYCNTTEDEKEMSGILIYTSSGDSEGTLGGLVRQGKADRLPKIIKSALDRALWCSNDPVCIESGGQGRGSLNLSACHSCMLLPETSCEEFNLLLDRTVLIGSLHNRDIGFF